LKYLLDFKLDNATSKAWNTMLHPIITAIVIQFAYQFGSGHKSIISKSYGKLSLVELTLPMQ
jgi:hypothetical protein